MENVLVTSGGSFQGSTIIKGLSRNNNIRIHLADCYRDNINKYNVNKFHHIQKVNNKEYIRILENLSLDEKIKIIFPSTDYELEKLSKNKRNFKRNNVNIAVSEYDILKILLDKKKTYSFLKKNGFLIQPIIDIQNENIEFPIIGKPINGFGSKGIIVVNNQKEHKKVIKNIEVKNYLWEPKIKDYEEFSVDFAIDFFGKISQIIIRRRIRTIGGFAVITQNNSDEIIKKEAKRLSEFIKLNGGIGIFNIQFLKYNHDCYHISDVNPRVGTSSIFSAGVGVNLPLFMCSILKSLKIKKSSKDKASQQVKMVRNISETWIKIIPKKEIKGVVFDLDDTLIDQKKWVFDKINILYKKYMAFLPEKDEFMIFVGQIFEEGKRSTLIDELAKAFKLSTKLKNELIEFYRRIKPKEIKIYNDVDDNLTRLKNLGLCLAIITDNPMRSQKQKIGMLNFKSIFDKIIYSDQYNTQKPNRFIFDTAAKELGIDNNMLIMVGDNIYRDCMGAIKADYKASFLIKREEAFYNFNHEFFNKYSRIDKKKVIEINNLNELFYSIDDELEF